MSASGLYERAAGRSATAALWHVDAARTFFVGQLAYNARHQHGAPVFLAGIYGPFQLRLHGGDWLSCRTAVNPRRGAARARPRRRAFRRYRAWRRVRVAINEIVKGSRFTTAAHAAGFADQAHFTNEPPPHLRRPALAEPARAPQVDWPPSAARVWELPRGQRSSSERC
jgi:hypothetical protein